MLSSDEKGKAFAAGANALPNRLGASHTRPHYIASLGLVRDDLWRRFTHLKLRAHLLDLCGLLFHHRRETRNGASFTIAARRATVPSNSAILFC